MNTFRSMKLNKTFFSNIRHVILLEEFKDCFPQYLKTQLEDKNVKTLRRQTSYGRFPLAVMAKEKVILSVNVLNAKDKMALTNINH